MLKLYENIKKYRKLKGNVIGGYRTKTRTQLFSHHETDILPCYREAESKRRRSHEQGINIMKCPTSAPKKPEGLIPSGFYNYAYINSA